MKKLWGIRHVRYVYNAYKFYWWWSQVSDIFIAPNPADVKLLEDIWSGKA